MSHDPSINPDEASNAPVSGGPGRMETLDLSDLLGPTDFQRYVPLAQDSDMAVRDCARLLEFLPLLRTLNVISAAEEKTSPEVKAGIGEIISSICDQNKMLSEAMRNQPGLFSPLLIEMLRVEERKEGGSLHAAFRKYTAYIDFADEVASDPESSRLAPSVRCAIYKLAMSIEEGIPILDALSIAAMEESEDVQALFKKVSASIREGSCLAAAFQSSDSDDLIDPVTVNLIDAGEEVGALDVCLYRAVS